MMMMMMSLLSFFSLIAQQVYYVFFFIQFWPTLFEWIRTRPYWWAHRCASFFSFFFWSILWRIVKGAAILYSLPDHFFFGFWFLVFGEWYTPTIGLNKLTWIKKERERKNQKRESLFWTRNKKKTCWIAEHTLYSPPPPPKVHHKSSSGIEYRLIRSSISPKQKQKRNNEKKTKEWTNEKS